WTESCTGNATIEWQSTGGNPNGNMYVHVENGKQSSNCYCNQSFTYNGLIPPTYANLSFDWNRSIRNTKASSVYVKLKRPNGTVVTLWNNTETNDQNWTYVSQDITNHFNDTGTYTIILYAYIEINGMENKYARVKWDNINITISWTDTTPPESITNLQNTTSQTWINWTWTNPSDTDFNYTIIYINDVWKENTSNNYYNKTGLTPNTIYNISTHTVDKSGNINSTWVNQTTKTNPDTTLPIWKNQGQNTSTPIEGNAVLLYAQGKDEVGLDLAILATNESGEWINYTDGTYGSPMDLGDAVDTWKWSNFTWQNNSVKAGTTVGWRIWYNDTSNNWNTTHIMTFDIQATSSANTTPLLSNFNPDFDPTYTTTDPLSLSAVSNQTSNNEFLLNGTHIGWSNGTNPNYTNSSLVIGYWNFTLIAHNSSDMSLFTSHTWNVTVTNYTISGYVFDNNGESLSGVSVFDNQSRSSTTSGSGGAYSLGSYYPNGTFNLTFSKNGFETGYLVVTIAGASNTSANKTIYDNTPPESIKNLANTTGNFWINWTWENPSSDLDHIEIWINGIFKKKVSVNYY
ncbi:MAG: carboxypeptidase-like regulatory domain-containing protein, partial [Methanosarcinales archaeon]